MGTFAGWNLWGNLASTLMGTGLNLLLNMFFGPVVNAARAIAVQVESAIIQFSTNFLMAVNPQITKLYAQRNITAMHNLIFRSSKLTFFLLLTLSLPVMIETNTILELWLSVENDAFYVFTHFLQHFYKGGVGLRQICDWCRLLWTCRDKLESQSLRSRIHRAGLTSEWKAFGAFAVKYLGMPTEAMPFYSADSGWMRKADKICSFILEVGNMGHNRDSSFFRKYPYVIRKACSLGRRISDLCHHARIFPLDSARFSFAIMVNGIKSALRGE